MMPDPVVDETPKDGETPLGKTAEEQAATLYDSPEAEAKAAEEKAASDAEAATEAAAAEEARISALPAAEQEAERTKVANEKAADEELKKLEAAKAPEGFEEKTADEIAAMSAREKAAYFDALAKAEDAAKPKEDREGAPEEYGKFETPEGFEELDKERLDAFLPIAKDMDLSQADTQKLIDHFAAEQTKIITEQVEAWEEQKATWLTSSKEDDEIGGKGFDQSVGKAVAALDQFGTPELREALDQTGMGSHPEVIRVFSRIGAAISEGKVITGGIGTQDADKTQAEVMYPSMAKTPAA